MNSESKEFNKEFNNWEGCYDYVYNKFKDGEFNNEVLWEREYYNIDVECYRDDMKLKDNDIVIGVWLVNESYEVYEVLMGE